MVVFACAITGARSKLNPPMRLSMVSGSSPGAGRGSGIGAPGSTAATVAAAPLGTGVAIDGAPDLQVQLSSKVERACQILHAPPASGPELVATVRPLLFEEKGWVRRWPLYKDRLPVL